VANDDVRGFACLQDFRGEFRVKMVGACLLASLRVTKIWGAIAWFDGLQACAANARCGKNVASIVEAWHVQRLSVGGDHEREVFAEALAA